MSITSLIRAKAYLLLQGIERSLANNLLSQIPDGDLSFFTDDDIDRAFFRLNQDIAWLTS